MAAGRCRLLTACYAGDAEVCLPQHATEEMCDTLQSAIPQACGGKARGAGGGAAAAGAVAASRAWRGPAPPLMFPPPYTRGRSGKASSSLPHALAGGIPGERLRPVGGPSLGFGMPAAVSEASEADAAAAGGGCEDLPALPSPRSESKPVSWRHDCRLQRARAEAERALVRRVADWGPQVGHLVDLRTGDHRPVTFWVRDDVRALCIFDRQDTQVRVYLCNHMASCQEAASSPEVSARQFFLGFKHEDLSRGLLVTMEKSHAVQVVHQGHIGTLRAQLLLICRDRAHCEALLGALRALTAELLLHEPNFDSGRSFRPVSEREGEEACDIVWPPLLPQEMPPAASSSGGGGGGATREKGTQAAAGAARDDDEETVCPPSVSGLSASSCGTGGSGCGAGGDAPARPASARLGPPPAGDDGGADPTC